MVKYIVQQSSCFILLPLLYTFNWTQYWLVFIYTCWIYKLKIVSVNLPKKYFFLNKFFEM